MEDNAKEPARFVCVQEPSGGWTVWDSHKEEPAIFDGEALIGQKRQRAEAARDMLERIHKGGFGSPRF